MCVCVCVCAFLRILTRHRRVLVVVLFHLSALCANHQPTSDKCHLKVSALSASRSVPCVGAGAGAGVCVCVCVKKGSVLAFEAKRGVTSQWYGLLCVWVCVCVCVYLSK